VTPTPYALQTRGLRVDSFGNVGIGTSSPTAELDVNGTVKANSFNGLPWQSPVWYIVNAAAGTQGFFPTVAYDPIYYGYNYRIPFNVTIQGTVISSSDDGAANVSIGLWVDGAQEANTGTVTFAGNYDSQIAAFSTPVNVAAGSVLTVKSVSGSNLEVYVWLYGRTNE
jgi:hypothetical protein